MHSARESEDATGRDADLPIALAAVTVAGQCRERSPVDLALFGEAAERFVERFADPLAGEALLARAVAEGAAEARAALITAAGVRPFRVSLWRQRGGDKLRLVAAFAAGSSEAPASHGGFHPDVARIAHEMHAPLGALIATAEALRGEGLAPDPASVERHASDVAVASWRVLRLAGELSQIDRAGQGAARQTLVEVDLCRLARRARRMALADADAASVTLEPIAAPTCGVMAGVLTDETVLWGVIDDLLRRAIRGAGAGGRVSPVIEVEADGGIALTIVAKPSTSVGEAATLRSLARNPARLPPRPDPQLRALAAMAGGTLELPTGSATGAQMRLGFAAARCLPLAETA